MFSDEACLCFYLCYLENTVMYTDRFNYDDSYAEDIYAEENPRKRSVRNSFPVSYAVFSYLRACHFSRKASHELLGVISDDGSKWTLRGCIRNGFYRRKLSRQMRNSFRASKALSDSRFQA